MADIELNNLTFTYPGSTEPVIDNLSLHIPAGESHALLGASGAGKTTLLNLLSGIEHPQSGTVLFDGQDVTQLGGRDRKVAQVFQFPVLYESLNVSANISFPLQNLNLGRQEIVERVRYIAQELNISELLDRSPQSLSLFEKQLVAVAKALVRPDLSVVLLDEPLTAVEPKIKWQLRRALRNVKRDLGVTMIYVTHDQTEALTFADRVSVLTAEGILQTDTPEQIYHNPTHEFVGHFIG
ncbi:MAG: ABC transporter ATP-binding protein, partial [Pseudomonadota bacterium]